VIFPGRHECIEFPSVLGHCQLNEMKGILPVKICSGYSFIPEGVGDSYQPGESSEKKAVSKQKLTVVVITYKSLL